MPLRRLNKPQRVVSFLDDSESVYMVYLHHYTKEIHIELFKDVQPVMPERLLSALKRTTAVRQLLVEVR